MAILRTSHEIVKIVRQEIRNRDTHNSSSQMLRKGIGNRSRKGIETRREDRM